MYGNRKQREGEAEERISGARVVVECGGIRGSEQWWWREVVVAAGGCSGGGMVMVRRRHGKKEGENNWGRELGILKIKLLFFFFFNSPNRTGTYPTVASNILDKFIMP